MDHGKYNAIAIEAADEILRHYIEGKGLLENVSLEGGFVDTPKGREINPGHSLEAAWFVMAEGVYQNNDLYKTKAKEIIDVSMRLGYRDGGIISFCDCDGFPPNHLEWDMKIWWPQCEAMIAFRMAYMLSGEEKYLKLYEEFKAYCEKYFLDSENGEWYGYLHRDGTVAQPAKGNIFKGPFHIPRMMIRCHTLCNEILG